MRCIEQNDQCYYCDHTFVDERLHPRSATIDHFIPKAKGGADDFANIVAACLECNQEKADNLWRKGCKSPLMRLSVKKKIKLERKMRNERAHQLDCHLTKLTKGLQFKINPQLTPAQRKARKKA